MASPAKPLPDVTQEKEGLSAKFGHWIALYAAYLFLAGWSYLKGYFKIFGIDTGWLDLGFNDTVARGFAVLFDAGKWLSIIYLVIFLLSMIVEVLSRKSSRIVNALVAVLLVFFFPCIYRIAGNAGIQNAEADRRDRSKLPTITFTAGSCDYRGKLVYIKSDLFYISNLAYLPSESSLSPCPFDLTGASGQIPQLWLVHSSELKDVRVMFYK